MAFGTRLTLKPCRGARLALSVPLGYRLLMLCLGGMVLLFMVLIPPMEAKNLFVPANTAPLVICLLSFLTAAYHERWLFDKGADRLVYQIGLRFLHANRVYRLSELRQVELALFYRGRLSLPAEGKKSLFSRPVLVLSLQVADGQVLRLENYGAFQKRRAKHSARAIAEYCGLPLADRTGGEA